MSTNITWKQLEDRLRPLEEEVRKLRPLVEEVRKLRPLVEEVRKLKNKLAKLEYSLIYRNMVARVTASEDRKKEAKKNPVLRQYLSAPQGRNSKLDVVKRQLHAVAHADKQGNRTYKRDPKDIRKMSKAIYKSKEKRKIPKWKELTEEHKKEHNRRWDAEFYKSRPRSVSSGSKRSGTTPSVGSLGRSTIYDTIDPMHKLLTQKNKWHANIPRARSV
jgi:hypothetical protein